MDKEKCGYDFYQKQRECQHINKKKYLNEDIGDTRLNHRISSGKCWGDKA